VPDLESPSDHLTLQFLQWLSDAPRTYGEAMEAWRTSCPRLSIWEDALREGLVSVEPGPAMRQAKVNVTAKGSALLRRY
jgi:hypothetical protein